MLEIIIPSHPKTSLQKPMNTYEASYLLTLRPPLVIPLSNIGNILCCMKGLMVPEGPHVCPMQLTSFAEFEQEITVTVLHFRNKTVSGINHCLLDNQIPSSCMMSAPILMSPHPPPDMNLSYKKQSFLFIAEHPRARQQLTMTRCRLMPIA